MNTRKLSVVLSLVLILIITSSSVYAETITYDQDWQFQYKMLNIFDLGRIDWESGYWGIPKFGPQANVNVIAGYQAPELKIPFIITMEYDSDEAYAGNSIPINFSIETHDRPGTWEFLEAWGVDVGATFKYKKNLFSKKWHYHKSCNMDYLIDLACSFDPPLGQEEQYCSDTMELFGTNNIPADCLFSKILILNTLQGMDFKLYPEPPNDIFFFADIYSPTDLGYIGSLSGPFNGDGVVRQAILTIEPNAQRNQIIDIELHNLSLVTGIELNFLFGIDYKLWKKEGTKIWNSDTVKSAMLMTMLDSIDIGNVRINQDVAEDIYPVSIENLWSYVPREGQEFDIKTVFMNLDPYEHNVDVNVYVDKKFFTSYTDKAKPNSTASESHELILDHGWHEVKMEVDPFDKIIENSSNNNLTRMIYVQNKPDLVVSDFEVKPTYTTSKMRILDYLSIYSNLTNVGEATTYDSYACVYDDGRLIATRYYPELASNQSMTLVMKHKYTVENRPGNHTFKVVADCEENVDEISESNNALEKVYYIEEIPELSVKSISTSWQAIEGEVVDLEAMIRNDRYQKTGDFGVYFSGYKLTDYVDKNIVIDHWDFFSVGTSNTSLPGMGSKKSSIVWNVPENYAGYHDIIVDVDVDDNVLEYKENNNQKITQVKVKDKFPMKFYKDWNFITLPNTPTADYVYNPTMTAQDLGDFLNSEFKTDMVAVLIQQWDGTRWETHVVTTVPGMPPEINNLISSLVNPKPNFIIKAENGYRVFCMPAFEQESIATFIGHQIIQESFINQQGWNSKGWYPDYYTQAKWIANHDNVPMVARWNTENQAWEFYINETITAPGPIKKKVNLNHLGSFYVFKGEGYMVFDKQEIDHIFGPFQDEYNSKSVKFEFDDKSITITPSGLWDLIEDPTTPDFVEPPLISIGFPGYENFTTIVDWNKIFNNAVNITKKVAEFVIDLPGLSNLRPDLKINEISYSTEYPKNYEEMEIIVNVENIGLNPAKDVQLALSIEPCTHKCLIGNKMLQSLDRNTEIEFSWIPVSGDYNIVANVNHDMKTVETFFDNNIMKKPISVSPKSIFSNTSLSGQDWIISYNTRLENENLQLAIQDIPYDFEITDVVINSNWPNWEKQISNRGIYVGMDQNTTGDIWVNLTLTISDKTKPDEYLFTLAELIDPNYHNIVPITLTVNHSGSTIPPEAFIDSITPGQANEGTSISFSGHGTDNETLVTEYYWLSSKDSVLSTQQNFSKVLSPGDHLIFFKVKDTSGTWSSPDIQEIHINKRPTADIVSVYPLSVMKEDEIFFKGDSSKDSVTYEWKSNIDGIISTKKEFSYSYLSRGYHTITFRSRDSLGAWSLASTSKVSVGKSVVYKTTPCTKGDDYFTTINSAINAAPKNTTVIVCPGTYNENVYINKPLKLISHSGPVSTIVYSSNPAQPAIGIDNAQNVHIEGFTVKGSNDPISGIGFGLVNSFFVNSTNNIITENTIGAGLMYSGINTFWNNRFENNIINADIFLSYFPNNWNFEYIGNYWDDYSGSGTYWIAPSNEDNYPLKTVSCGDILTESTFMINDLNNCPSIGLKIDSNNKVLDCNGHKIDGVSKVYGVYVDDKDGVTLKNCVIEEFDTGVYFYNSAGSLISNNNVSKTNNGIYLYQNGNNKIQNNLIENNYLGLNLFNSDGNIVSGNNIKNNVDKGISIDSDNNDLWNNTLFNNNYGIYLINADSNSLWDNNFDMNNVNSYESYQANHNLWDLNHVGNWWNDFSSNPGFPLFYEIFGPGLGIDWFPNNKKNSPPIITSTPPLKAKIDQLYTYNLQASDPDGDPLVYDIKFYPFGMTINSGLIAWTPTNGNTGLPEPNNKIKVATDRKSLPGTGPMNPMAPGSPGSVIPYSGGGGTGKTVIVRVLAEVSDGYDTAQQHWEIEVSN